MAFTPLTPAEVAPDQPISTTLMDKIRTNLDDHEARILASASGGSIGEVLNGSFETAQGGNPNWPDKWAISQYSGGQVILDGAQSVHGKKSLKMIHSVAMGGGGAAESDYIGVSSIYMPPLNFSYLCTAANLQIEVWVRYYAADANGDPSTYLGERRIFQRTSGNPLTWSAAQIHNVPLQYSATRYVKYRFVGGVSGTDFTGTVWFDAVGVPIRRVFYPLDNPNPINQGGLGQSSGAMGWTNYGSTWNLNLPSGFRWLVVRGACLNHWNGTDDYGNPWFNDPYMRFTLAGTGRYSTAITDNQRGLYQALYPAPAIGDSRWKWNDMVFDFAGLAGGTYTLQFQMMTSGTNYYWCWIQCPTIVNVSNHYLTSGFIQADGTTLLINDVYNSVPLW